MKMSLVGLAWGRGEDVIGGRGRFRVYEYR